MKKPINNAKDTFSTATAVANTAVPITLAAVAGEVHVIDSIQYSYLGGTPAGNLTVVAGSTTLLDLDISGQGAGTIEFHRGLYGAENQQVVITLAAGGADAVGTLNVQSH